MPRYYSISNIPLLSISISLQVTIVFLHSDLSGFIVSEVIVTRVHDSHLLVTIAFWFLSLLYSNKFEVIFYKVVLITICENVEMYTKTINCLRLGGYKPIFTSPWAQWISISCRPEARVIQQNIDPKWWFFPRALAQGKYHHWGLIFCRITRAEGLKMIYYIENFNCSSPGQLVNIPSRIRRFVFYSNKPFSQSSLRSGMK